MTVSRCQTCLEQLGVCHITGMSIHTGTGYARSPSSNYDTMWYLHYRFSLWPYYVPGCHESRGMYSFYETQEEQLCFVAKPV